LQLAPFHSPTLISKAKGTAIAVPFALEVLFRALSKLMMASVIFANE
jgi:hypothetical protein